MKGGAKKYKFLLNKCFLLVLFLIPALTYSQEKEVYKMRSIKAFSRLYDKNRDGWQDWDELKSGEDILIIDDETDKKWSIYAKREQNLRYIASNVVFNAGDSVRIHYECIDDDNVRCNVYFTKYANGDKYVSIYYPSYAISYVCKLD